MSSERTAFFKFCVPVRVLSETHLAASEKNREKINKTVREWYRKKHNTPKTSYKKP